MKFVGSKRYMFDPLVIKVGSDKGIRKVWYVGKYVTYREKNNNHCMSDINTRSPTQTREMSRYKLSSNSSH